MRTTYLSHKRIPAGSYVAPKINVLVFCLSGNIWQWLCFTIQKLAAFNAINGVALPVFEKYYFYVVFFLLMTD